MNGIYFRLIYKGSNVDWAETLVKALQSWSTKFQTAPSVVTLSTQFTSEPPPPDLIEAHQLTLKRDRQTPSIEMGLWEVSDAKEVAEKSE